MNDLAIAILTGLSALLGVGELPKKNSPEWTISSPWVPNGPYWTLSATSQRIVEECKASPNGFVKFPTVVQGAHEVFLDKSLIYSFGDPTFNSVQSFYGSPIISCALLQHGSILEWKAYSYTRYFARVLSYPKFTPSQPTANIFLEEFNAIASGILFCLALFTYLFLRGRESLGLTLSLTFSQLSMGLYFAGSVAGRFHLNGDMLTLHRVADTGVWVGFAAYYNALRLIGIVGNRLYAAYLINIAFGILLIVTAKQGDAIQLGTSTPFFFSIVLNIYSAIKVGRRQFLSQNKLPSFFAFLSLITCLFAAINEILIVTGVYEGVTIFNIGFVFGLLFFVLSVNENISQAYRELAELKVSLEDRVQSKTIELTEKNSELEVTLNSLKRAQADLVQSEKLASLGTLAAGVAHEINNAINFVSGAIAPIRKMTNRIEDDNTKQQTTVLLDTMKSGVDIIATIVAGLGTYSGRHEASVKEVELSELCKSVLAILSSRIKPPTKVLVEMAPGLRLVTNSVGLHQILTNLVSNASDAMPDGGTITIRAQIAENRCTISVSDTGVGIPSENANRIFDPFFTTKEVGKGTGLGLHIVRREVENLKGTLTVDSKVGVGSTFTLSLPLAP